MLAHGLARFDPDLSVKHCAEFARLYNFFFYTGQNGTLTRMLSLPA